MGLAGLYILRDPLEDTLSLPSGEFDVPLVVQDRTLDGAGRIIYPARWTPHVFGTLLLVNGKVWPFMTVKKAAYRFRLLNGCNSRFLTLSLDAGTAAPPAMVVIATDRGFAATPVTVSDLTLGPGERVELLLDFSGAATGAAIVLRNSAGTPFPAAAGVVPVVLQFQVSATTGPTPAPPAALDASVAGLVQQLSRVVTQERWLELSAPSVALGTSSVCDLGQPSAFLINGRPMMDITELPTAGSVELWHWVNPTATSHPLHIHAADVLLAERRTFSRNISGAVVLGGALPASPWEAGLWKDTVQVPPGSVTSVLVRFASTPGRFVYHCHMLDHEDWDMMRSFRVAQPNCNNNGACDTGEDCVGCAADCATGSAARCGNGVCEAGDGETCGTCPSDCLAAPAGFCCGQSGSCADPRCGNGTRVCTEAPRPSACCGDFHCEGSETVNTCSIDCAAVPNAAPTAPPTSAPSVVPTGPAVGSVSVLRINCGGGAFTDAATGLAWSADRFFLAGDGGQCMCACCGKTVSADCEPATVRGRRAQARNLRPRAPSSARARSSRSTPPTAGSPPRPWRRPRRSTTSRCRQPPTQCASTSRTPTRALRRRASACSTCTSTAR